jgi:hypothetical protein
MRLQIVRSVLASFMNMPGSNVGSFALSKDQSQLFLDSLSSSGDQFGEVFNLNAIPQLLNLNFRGLKLSDMPKLEHSRIGQRDVRWLGRSLGELAANGLLTPDPEMESRLREILDLPDIPEEQSRDPVNNPPPADFEKMPVKPVPGEKIVPIAPVQVPAETVPNAPPNLPAPKIAANQKWRPSTRLARERRPYQIRTTVARPAPAREAADPRPRADLNADALAQADALRVVFARAMRAARIDAEAVLEMRKPVITAADVEASVDRALRPIRDEQLRHSVEKPAAAAPPSVTIEKGAIEVNVDAPITVPERVVKLQNDVSVPARGPMRVVYRDEGGEKVVDHLEPMGED